MSSTELTLDSKDIQFILKEWLKIEQLAEFPAYEDFDAETMDLLVKEGHNFAKEVIAPTLAEADRLGCKLVDGRARVPECIKLPYKQAYELGWASLTMKQENGGQGAPLTLGTAVREAIIAANPGLSMYFGLTEGAAGLIDEFGTDELKEKFVHKMATGEFTGTMCLSEPQAGSDVGASTTIADPLGNGLYKIKGTKCWISSGDNDLGDNVVHAVLARVKGAPEGSKGLSLFVVPFYRVNADGSLAESNDVTVAALEHKMGINCSTTAVLNFGENNACYGYLLGEENQGMAEMFKMMNEARLEVAMIGLSIGAAAYENALAYAKERYQGPHISKLRDPEAPRVQIIEHPDVRNMLTHMKARVEAMRALMYGASEIWDRVLVSEGDDKQEYDDFLQILTPMCKGWCSEVGLDVVRSGIQVLGGVGYTRDFPLEQYYRDLRVSAIYEGTTGIQALDLVGRKMTTRGGELFMKLMGRFGQLAEEHAEHPQLGSLIQAWGQHGEYMAETGMTLQSLAGKKGIEFAALYATPYLMFSSSVTAGYFLMQQALVASDKLEALKAENKVDEAGLNDFLASNSDARFYANKLKTIHFYVNVVIPTYKSLVEPVHQGNFDPLEISL